MSYLVTIAQDKCSMPNMLDIRPQNIYFPSALFFIIALVFSLRTFISCVLVGTLFFVCLLF